MILVKLEDACAAVARLLGLESIDLAPDAVSQAVGSLNWKRLPQWESMDDGAIADTTGLVECWAKEDLLVVTEGSLAKHSGGFRVSSEHLRILIAEHLRLCGEAFFNGDVIVTGLRSGAVWLFHHTGFFAFYANARQPDS